MTRIFEILLLLLLFGLFVSTYIFMYEDEKTKAMDIAELNILRDDSIGLVNRDSLVNFLNSDSLNNWKSNYGNCDVNFVEKKIKNFDFVKDADVYKSTNGGIYINIIQKDVKIRVISQNIENFYLTSDFELLSTVEYYAADVMVLSCSDEFLLKLKDLKEKSKKNAVYYNFIQNLCNFVEFIDNDPFWREMVVQLNVNEKEEIEMISRVGSHLVVMCDIEDFSDFENYFSKLKGFYKNILPKKGWSEYSLINLKFKEMVVASR